MKHLKLILFLCFLGFLLFQINSFADCDEVFGSEKAETLVSGYLKGK